MEIKLFNSLSNQIETFVPLEEGKVSMYVCGPTVYDYVHIGNMRPVVVFDTLRRFLSYVGYKVTYVSNYTDVDDKIIIKAQKTGKTEKEITDFYIGEFEKDVRLIHSKLPNITPRVTEYMPQIISFIDELVKKDAAYIVDDDVYFKVSADPKYVPISLSTSGGALIAGLVFGWLRSKHPTFGRIPEPSLWVLNNVGLNMFIACENWVSKLLLTIAMRDMLLSPGWKD